MTRRAAGSGPAPNVGSGPSSLQRPSGLAPASRIRWIAVRGVAAALAGIVVLGVGGRLVMLGSRLLHPEAVGRFTENGNRIGEFTTEGTLGLVVFGGLFGGLLAGVIWASVRPWVPPRPALVGAAAMAIGGFLIVEADNPDFVVLRNPGIDLLLLLGLVFGFGATLCWVDHRLERRLPAARGLWTVGYGLVVTFGVPVVIPAFGSFLSDGFCFCERPPVWTGAALLATATLTIWELGARMRGRGRADRARSVLARSTLALAVATGAVHLTGQIVRIV